VSLALPEALYFTGIDWAAETHAVYVLDATGKIADQFTIEHSADGIATLACCLARYGAPGGLPVAIERPDGRLADLLAAATPGGATSGPGAARLIREPGKNRPQARPEPVSAGKPACAGISWPRCAPQPG
jgi:hypothetical protein